ncbi:MAG: FAD:protein FMN transferase [Clostridia bacterium]|nr:FAD:protein FMN transferase [Clostridia bacterium]
MKKIAAVLLMVFIAVSLAACAPNREYMGFGFMGTFYSFKGVGGVEQKELEKKLLELENLVSVDGELKKINEAKAGEAVKVDAATYSLIKFAVDFNKNSSALDISLYPIVKLWGFDNTFNENSSLTPPDDQSITQTLTHVGLDLFEFDDENMTVTKKDDLAALDLGALGKGYAVSYLLEKCGFKEGILNLGGTIGAIGKEYKVGIEPPFGGESYFAVFTLKSGEVCSTSGNYQRNYVYEGTLYHHIFGDNGRPVENSLASVTVVCGSGAAADALSTACYVLGAEKSKELLDLYDASAVFVYEDKNVSSYKLDVNVTSKDYKLKVEE